MSHPVAERSVISDEAGFGLRTGWPHEYLRVERDKWGREKDAPLHYMTTVLVVLSHACRAIIYETDCCNRTGKQVQKPST